MLVIKVNIISPVSIKNTPTISKQANENKGMSKLLLPFTKEKKRQRYLEYLQSIF